MHELLVVCITQLVEDFMEIGHTYYYIINNSLPRRIFFESITSISKGILSCS